jgi:hypothetical protein
MRSVGPVAAPYSHHGKKYPLKSQARAFSPMPWRRKPPRLGELESILSFFFARNDAKPSVISPESRAKFR